MNKLSRILLLNLFLLSCVKDKPNPDENTLPTNAEKGIFVINEGAYGNYNADISWIDNENKIYNNLFKVANNQYGGDVLQDLDIVDNVIYLTYTNSSKVDIIDKYTFKKIKSIEGLNSPRYFQKVNNIAFVTSLYSKNIYIINLQTNTIEKTISIDYNSSENLIYYNDAMYVTNWDTACNYIYKINTVTQQIESRIPIAGAASHDIVLDKFNRLWALSGNSVKQKTSYLTCINTTNFQIEKSFQFSQTENPFRLILNSSKDTLFYINVNYTGASTNNGIYQLSIYDTLLPTLPLIPAFNNSYFWGVGIHPTTHHIYVSDPKGFSQQSTIYQYTPSGEIIKTYTSGIGSSAFYFLP